ncbi:MAG: prolipoprotein diacylglyceryl transferase [Pseudomonadota bacterium]
MDGASLVATAIAFPSIDPVIFSIGPVAVRWYSLAYIVGIIGGWKYAQHLVQNANLWRDDSSPITVADLDDFLFWAVIGIVVGGRLGYVLFYNPAFYLQNPGEIIAVWQGGMSFHGGFLGVALALWFFAKKRGLPLLSLVDVVAAVVPIGIFFGRLANFINSELWGRTTDVPWAVIFPNGGPVPRHPTQLYEAILEGLVLFAALRLATHYLGTLKSPGVTGAIFVAGYGAFRTLVEFYREPDAQIGYLFGGWFTMGMLLSLPMFVFGVMAMRQFQTKARAL